MGPNGGRLFANLAAVWLAPADIDAVVVSHTHPDHVGNLRAADGGRAFPRAVIGLSDHTTDNIACIGAMAVEVTSPSSTRRASGSTSGAAT